MRKLIRRTVYFMSLPAIVLFLFACVLLTPDPQRIWLENESRYRYELDSRYPNGSQRTEIVARYGLPSKTIVISVEAKIDRFASVSLEMMKRDMAARSRYYEIYQVDRSTLGSSLGAVGTYLDYIFYDDTDRIISAYRRFVD